MWCLWEWVAYFSSFSSITYNGVEDERDSLQLELLWLQLRARSRGAHRNIRALIDDAKDTTHFAKNNEHELMIMVYGNTTELIT